MKSPLTRFFRLAFLAAFLAAVIGGPVACGRKSAKPRIPRAPNGAATAAVAEDVPPLRRDFKLPLPIAAGERLVYEVRVARFPLFAAVGDVTFEYVGETAAPRLEGWDAAIKPAGGEDRFLHFRASAASKGFIVKTLLGIDVDDRFEAIARGGDFASRAGMKRIDEGKKQFLQTALFDREKLTAFYRTVDLNKPAQPPAEKSFAIAADAQDLLSAFYFVRLQRLRAGDVLRFPLLFDAEQHEFELVVGGREEVETEMGRVKTIKLEPKLCGKGDDVGDGRRAPHAGQARRQNVRSDRDRKPDEDHERQRQVTVILRSLFSISGPGGKVIFLAVK
jgi:hypothetical protein